MNLEQASEVSAPCNFAMFGYDLAEYKNTAVGVSLDRRIRCRSGLEERFKVNGEELDSKKHPYVRASIIHGWSDIDTPVAMEIDRLECPKNSLGYHSASVISSLSSLSMLHDRLIFEDIALKGHDVLSTVEPDMGPLGTSAATHGSGIIASKTIREDLLWSVKTDVGINHIHRLDMPDMTFIVAFSDAGGDSLYSKVRHSIRRQKSFTKDLFKEAGTIAEKGITAVRDGNFQKIGEMMNETDKISSILGMYDEKLKKMAGACKRDSYGVKVSSTADGGCIVALTDEPDEVLNSLAEIGVIGHTLKISKEGIRV